MRVTSNSGESGLVITLTVLHEHADCPATQRCELIARAEAYEVAAAALRIASTAHFMGTVSVQSVSDCRNTVRLSSLGGYDQLVARAIASSVVAAYEKG